MAGLDSCTCVPGDTTSNASTTTRAFCAAMFCRPVTRIVKVWLALASPFSVNMGTRISSVLEYVSTSATRPPSSNTLAMPDQGARPPIHLTDGPVKVNVASAPGEVETAAVPPLHDLLVSWAQPAP